MRMQTDFLKKWFLDGTCICHRYFERLALSDSSTYLDQFEVFMNPLVFKNLLYTLSDHLSYPSTFCISLEPI